MEHLKLNRIFQFPQYKRVLSGFNTSWFSWRLSQTILGRRSFLLKFVTITSCKRKIIIYHKIEMEFIYLVLVFLEMWQRHSTGANLHLEFAYRSSNENHIRWFSANRISIIHTSALHAKHVITTLGNVHVHTLYIIFPKYVASKSVCITPLTLSQLCTLALIRCNQLIYGIRSPSR